MNTIPKVVFHVRQHSVVVAPQVKHALSVEDNVRVFDQKLEVISRNNKLEMCCLENVLLMCFS